MITTAEIRLALAKRYQRPNHILLREVANRIGFFPLKDGTTDTHLRYADYMAVAMTKAQGKKPLSIIGIEVKVSRSDYRTELKTPEKSIMKRYCDEWFLCCPKGLIDPKELPDDQWGLIYVADDLTTRIVKKSVKAPAELTRDFLASIMSRYAGEPILPVDEILREYRDCIPKEKPVQSDTLLKME